MPGGDRTGPFGEGPMTGRGAGFCSGNDVRRGAPCGRFSGRRGGMGFRRGFMTGGSAGRYYPGSLSALSPEEERENLRREAEFLESELNGIRDRIGRLEKPEENS